jgi:hypothetical protein
MNALEHRTAAQIAKAKQKLIIEGIQALPSEMCDAEFNRRLSKLECSCQEWALLEIEHTQAAERAARC